VGTDRKLESVTGTKRVIRLSRLWLSRRAYLQIEWRWHKYRLKLFRRFCGDRLQDPRIAKAGAGFVTSKTPTDPAYTPHPDRDENGQLARFANLLFHYTGQKSDEDIASILGFRTATSIPSAA
jgi:hypothetical protein